MITYKNLVESVGPFKKYLLPNGNIATIDSKNQVVKGTVARPREVKMPNGITQVNHYLADKIADRRADEVEAQKFVDQKKHKPYKLDRRDSKGNQI